MTKRTIYRLRVRLAKRIDPRPEPVNANPTIFVLNHHVTGGAVNAQPYGTVPIYPFGNGGTAA